MKKAKLKILCLSTADNGGNSHFIAEAVRQYTNHETKSVRLVNTYLDYPIDIFAPSESELINLIAWADVLHLRDNWFKLPPQVNDKPAVVTFSGNSYRRRFAFYRHNVKQRDWLTTVSTIDLTMISNSTIAEWFPNPREDKHWEGLQRHEKFTVCQSPTFRERKGTATFEKAMDRMGCAYDVIERTSYSDCLSRRSLCHVTVDQFRCGYGNSGIEAWSLGQPVIGHAGMFVGLGKLIDETFGFCPWLDCPENVKYLIRKIEALRDNPQIYSEWVDRGREWFLHQHSYKAVAERAVQFYEQALWMKGRVK